MLFTLLLSWLSILWQKNWRIDAVASNFYKVKSCTLGKLHVGIKCAEQTSYRTTAIHNRLLNPMPNQNTSTAQHALFSNTPPLLLQPLCHPPFPHHITISCHLQNASTKQSPSWHCVTALASVYDADSCLVKGEDQRLSLGILTVVCGFSLEGIRAMNLVSTPFEESKLIVCDIGAPFSYRPRCSMIILKECSSFGLQETPWVKIVVLKR